jgi:hypothetical protein
VGFGGKGFHESEKGTKTTGRGRECQILARASPRPAAPKGKGISADTSLAR